MSSLIIHSMKNSEILTCFQCGTCHASCPSGKYTSLNVRKIVRDSVRKDVSSAPELWMCTTCYNCQERCPRGIKVTDAVLTLRSEAVKKGKILPAHRIVCNFLIETGHAIPLDDTHLLIRRQIELDAPETVYRYPAARKEVQALLRSTGFDELIRE
ncbi:MAG: CoB--CoM heterodisulfide reductase subunit C [Candidatus Methanoperedens sp.]|nr:CoB--CoM heterodisulfide reductase subunit C [Candidatus Methanoperedens sp.]MCZ7360491.1 CoB--CoM heterodisulfide reductase subunit C [Candidatus Methanoperedens sp.]HLB72297.1 CoB--CoM heterodisulfide reductase subunit C [Candidatus Methanoperedens sp.]